MALFTQEELDSLNDDYRKLIEFYHKHVKIIVVASERLSEGQKISAPSVIEIRSSFDHIARVHAIMYSTDVNINSTDSGLSNYDYCIKNLDKAHAHLYRAAYDAYDVIAITLQKEVEKLLNSISRETLFAVIKDAHDKIYLPYHSARDLVTKEKINKDVSSKVDEQKQFAEYEVATNQLKDVQEYILKHMKALTEYEEARRKEEDYKLSSHEKKEYPWKQLAIASFVLTVISAIITVYAFYK